jgi:DNA repair exonuclease SbcCD ATPase subunit
MYKKISSIPLLIALSLFLGCSNKPVKKQNETMTESSFVGKVLVGTLTLLGTKGNIGKALNASRFGGNASSYFVGKKLSDMQKRYKAKEEELIANILKIDVESSELREKNSQLVVELDSMQKKIKALQADKELKENQKALKQASIKVTLQENKKRLQQLLSQNQQVSEKISFSKTKAKEYEYTKEDRKEILKSVALLEKSSQQYAQEINKNIASINTMISTL